MPVHQDDHFHLSLVVVCHLLLFDVGFCCDFFAFCRFLLLVLVCRLLLFVVYHCLSFVVVCRLSKILKTAVISFVNNSL